MKVLSHSESAFPAENEMQEKFWETRNLQLSSSNATIIIQIWVFERLNDLLKSGTLRKCFCRVSETVYISICFVLLE